MFGTGDMLQWRRTGRVRCRIIEIKDEKSPVKGVLNMSELEKILKGVLLGGVGVVATAVEKTEFTMVEHSDSM